LFKLTGDASREDDWHRITIPPYTKIYSFYESGLRSTAPTILPMDERLINEIKIFALLADSGAITEEQGRQLATQATRNFLENFRREVQQLTYDYNVALASDNQIHQAILAGLAAGAIIAGTAALTSRDPVPVSSPVHQTFTVTDFTRGKGRVYSCTSTPNQITCF
jgi:hypothetical protein